MKLDRETAEQMREGDIMRQLVNSEGWALAKKMLAEQIAVLDSVSSIPSNMPLEEIGKQAMFRAHAISLVQSWLDAVEGRVEQHSQQSALLAEVATDEIIRNHY